MAEGGALGNKVSMGGEKMLKTLAANHIFSGRGDKKIIKLKKAKTARMACRDRLAQWMAAEGCLYTLLTQFGSGNGVLHQVICI